VIPYRRRAGAYGPGFPSKSHTWATAAAELLTNYRAYQTRNPVEVEKTLRTLTRYFHGWKLADVDTPAIQRYAVHERGKGLAAATANLQLATLRRALRLAQTHLRQNGHNSGHSFHG
jgi:hypothetical protein